jgi:uncharacterized protein with FMN-binding domain
MRRAPVVITCTVLGTAGVLLFKPLPTSAVAGATDASASEATTPTSDASTPSPSSSTSASSSASPSASTGAEDGTYTGAAETTRFGTTQVKVSISGGRITDVAAVQLNQDDPRSTQISQEAAPLLRTEVLAKQTAAVDAISGATYTTDAYEASLQSALDAAGYTAPDGSKASTDVSSIEESGGGH